MPTIDLNRRQFQKLIATGAVTGLAGCAGSDNDGAANDDNGSTTPGSGQSDSDGDDGSGSVYEHVRVALHAEPSTLNPYYEGLDREQLNIQLQSYEHLLTRNNDMEIVSNLATSWEPNGDSAWDIELREDVEFHNGTEFTAETVAGAFDLMMEEGRSPGLRDLMASVTNVEVTGDYSLTFHTDGFLSTLPSRLTTYSLIVEPNHYQEISDQERTTQTMGTGPFVLEEWDQGNKIKFTRNENWWNGTPLIKRLTFNIVPEPSTRVNALTQGDVQISAELPANLSSQVQSSDGVEITDAPSVRVLWIDINPEKEPFGDSKVRQAINYAVDKNAIIEELFSGYGQIQSQGIPESCFGYNPDINAYEFNPEEAQSLLADAGYQNGFETTLRTTEEKSELAQAVAGYLSNVGIDTNVEVMDPTSKITEFQDGNAAPLETLDYGNYSLFDAAGTYPYCFHSEGIWGLTSRENLDTMIDDAMTIIDQDEREQKWQDVGRAVHDNGDKLFLLAQNTLHGKDSRITGFEARSDNLFHLDHTS